MAKTLILYFSVYDSTRRLAEGGAGKSVEKWLTKLGLKKYVESRHAHA